MERSTILRHLAAGLTAVACLAASGGAAAQSPPSPTAQDESERAAARKLGKEGVEAFRAGDFSAALDRLTRAHKLVGLTTTGLWRARSLVKLGRLVEASEQYLEVTRMKLGDDARPLHREAIGEANGERRALLKRIPEITLQGPVPADAEVRLDDRVVPPALIGVGRPIDPGRHRVVVVRGGVTRPQDFDLQEGERRSITLEVPAAGPSPMPSGPGDPVPSTPTPPPDDTGGGGTQVALGWVAVGLGGASLLAGAVTGGLAIGKQTTLEEGCPEGQCGPDLHGEVDSFELLRNVSIGTFVAGGVLAVTGVTLLLTAPSTSDDVALRLGPIGATLFGSF